jgi:hypothetical protein
VALHPSSLRSTESDQKQRAHGDWRDEDGYVQQRIDPHFARKISASEKISGRNTQKHGNETRGRGGNQTHSNSVYYVRRSQHTKNSHRRVALKGENKDNYIKEHDQE